MVRLIRLIQIVAVLWLLRSLWRSVMGMGARSRSVRQGQSEGPFQPRPQASPETALRGGEMKKDPQCGTYVSTELSLRSKFGSEELHFCSAECQQEFLHARASKAG